MPNKKAILVVSFGTSYHDALELNIESIESEIATAFPGWEIRRAFTSGMIIRKLLNRDKIHIDTVQEALERLLDEGFDTVLCQPTHILNGEEYDDIVADAQEYRARFETFAIGAPLLTSASDFHELATIISDTFPKVDDTALCLMGHGSEHHHADAAYAALEYHFRDLGRDDVFVATVEGFPDLVTLMRHVAAYGSKRLTLAPLMVVAGDHAKNDMASNEDDSWKTIFERAGYQVQCILKGLGEYPSIRELYISHLRAVLVDYPTVAA